MSLIVYKLTNLRFNGSLTLVGKRETVLKYSLLTYGLEII